MQFQENDSIALACGCCNRQKAKLIEKKSALLKGHILYLCETCIAERKEPRYVVILAGRTHGIQAVKDYIIKQRYCGRIIEAKEITV